MASLPAMLREFRGSEKREFCRCEEGLFLELADAANKATFEEAGMLKHFRSAFYSKLELSGWRLDIEFGKFPQMGRARASVTIDSVSNYDCADCGHRHRVFVEMCTDNRQAILANLMKLEFAGREFRKNYPDGVSVGVGIFLSEHRKATLKNRGYVDGAIGSLEEYEIQASGPWDGLISTTLLALTI